MKAYLYIIFSSFVYTIGKNIHSKKENFNKETNFVFSQFLNLSWYFCFAFSIITILVSFSLSKNGVPFHRLNEQDRKKKLGEFSKFKIDILQDFLKFFNSLTVFAIYSYENVDEVRVPQNG